MQTRAIGRVVAWAVMPMFIIALHGCRADDDFGQNVSVPQNKRHALAGVFAGSRTLSLPGDRVFNVTDTQRRSEGPATATSTATPSGSASCVADASRGGSGTAEFQLGHVLTYDGASPVQVTVTFNVVYECKLEHYAPQFGRVPLGLKAYVADSNRRILGKVMLAQGDPDGLAGRWSGSQSPSFDMTLEPGLAYHLIVAGRVEVSAGAPSGPVAALHVKSLNIEVWPR